MDYKEEFISHINFYYEIMNDFKNDPQFRKSMVRQEQEKRKNSVF